MPTAVASVFPESSQHRRWTLSADDLRSRRQAVNERVVALVKSNMEEESKLTGKPVKVPDFPSYEEELLIVNYYASKISDTGAVFNLPSHLKATAATYLRRFYLAHSALQYHPKKIMITCLFLATKTCEHHVSLDDFVSKVPKQTRESVLEHEFLISSAIKFDFVHWSAYRPLYGLVLDMENMVKTQSTDQEASTARIKHVLQVHDAAKARINACIWSDLPFTYSPANLAMAALYSIDASLVDEYLTYKNCENMASGLREIRDKFTETAATRFDTQEIMDRVKAADKKVYYASDPAMKENSALYMKRKEQDEKQESARRQEKSEAAKESHEALGAVLA